MDLLHCVGNTQTTHTKKNLCCPICYNLIQCPVQCKECEYLFCKTCVFRWLLHKNSCPHCRKEGESQITYKSSFLKNNLPSDVLDFLDGVKVKCFVHPKCDMIINYNDIRAHPHWCLFAEVKCPNGGCNHTCIRQ